MASHEESAAVSTEAAVRADRPARPARPTPLATLIARESTLSRLEQSNPDVRRIWSQVRADLDQSFMAEKYDAKALQGTKDTLTGFLAEGSKATLGDAERSLDKLSTSLIPAKAPAELERSFWERVSQARHQSYLAQLHAIYKAAEASTEHTLAKAEYTVLSFRDRHKAESNQLDVSQVQAAAANGNSPSIAPVFEAPAPGSRFHDLPDADRKRIRDLVRTTAADVAAVPRAQLSQVQKAALFSLMQTAGAYMTDKASAADLQRAAEAMKITPPPRPDNGSHPRNVVWQAVVIDSRNLAHVAQHRTALLSSALPIPSPPVR